MNKKYQKYPKLFPGLVWIMETHHRPGPPELIFIFLDAVETFLGAFWE